MNPIVSIRNLSISYPGAGARSAVKHINMDILPGQAVGLVGESGCGKTTLALALMGMLPPGCDHRGEIIISGQKVDFYQRPGQPSARDHCAMIFQNPQTSLNPVISIGTQINRIIQRYSRLKKSAIPDRLAELLMLVGLPDHCGKLYPHELSGGMQQRVLLAMALAREASILIADEPTTALDAGTRLQILNLLKQLQEKQNLSLLLISHDLSAIARVCQQVAIVYQGRIVEQAPQKLIYTQPRHPYSAGLLAAIPKIHPKRPRKLQTLLGEANHATEQSGCGFASRCPRREAYCEQQLPPLNATLEKNQHFACFNPRPLPTVRK
ncbi:MAG: ABC transporter ATP-binding protein [Xanthomonadales bacterium]|nr:ABC transporter ATP-binding protein [Xanthomonadales bacterium]